MRPFAGLLLLAALCRPAYGQAAPDSVARHLIALEQEWNDAILRTDRAAAGAYMAEDWTEITSDGAILTKTEDLDELAGGYHPVSLRLSELHVDLVGDGAVVSGVSDEQSSYRGRDTSGRFRWMDVWVRRGGRWLCLRSSVTRVAAQ